MKVHPGADRRNISIPVREYTLRTSSGKRMLFSRVEPREPSSLYGMEVLFLVKGSIYGICEIYQERD